jgi:hypothetical protein
MAKFTQILDATKPEIMCYDMDEFHQHRVQQKKSDTKSMYDSKYIKVERQAELIQAGRSQDGGYPREVVSRRKYERALEILVMSSGYMGVFSL